ncbi:MAG: GNAT family N-acetyltransferase [Bacteroidota bacterium]|nr:GNAT family N-acetyltransferase [Bacteroidota bacterium]
MHINEERDTVRLEYFTPTDFRLLMDWINHEELLIKWSGSTFSFPLTEEDLNWYIKDANEPEKSDVLIYKAVDTSSGETIGHISLGSINRENKSARITRVLIGKPCARGKGYCKQMMQAILQIGFEELNLHRISLGVYEKNLAAIQCYQKVGFKTDGVLRDIKRYGDTYWSLVEMSILEEEWGKINFKEISGLHLI